MLPGMGGMDPRQMSMMMKKLGIDVRDIEGVEQVVVRTAGKEYVFDKASVSVMKAQGVETWQVSGKPRVVERGAGGVGSGEGRVMPPNSSSSATVAAPTSAKVPLPTTDPAPYEPSGEDVALVAKETGKTPAVARQALVEAKGDLAEAIVRLQG